MRRGCVNSLPSFFLGFGTAVGSGIIGESFGPESTEKTTQKIINPTFYMTSSQGMTSPHRLILTFIKQGLQLWCLESLQFFSNPLLPFQFFLLRAKRFRVETLLLDFPIKTTNKHGLNVLKHFECFRPIKTYRMLRRSKTVFCRFLSPSSSSAFSSFFLRFRPRFSFSSSENYEGVISHLLIWNSKN